MNQRVQQAQQLGAAQANQIRMQRGGSSRSFALPPAGGEPAQPPELETITPSPIVPGTNVVIESGSFGPDTGSVRLVIQGQTFSLDVNYWDDEFVIAHADDDLSGVRETQGAVVELMTSEVQSASKPAAFVPIYVSESMRSGAWLIHSTPRALAARIFDNIVLESDWIVTEWHFESNVSPPWSIMAGCSIIGSPAVQSGGTALTTRVHVSTGYLTTAGCQLTIEAEGPRGVDHGVPLISGGWLDTDVTGGRTVWEY